MSTTHSHSYDDVLARLWGVHESIPGQQATARCPAHPDRKASLSVGRGADGTLLLDCHAGCRFEDILAALTLEGSEQEDQANGHHAQREPLGPVVAIYYYRAADGTVLYRVTRHDPKAFRPWRPDGQGGWIMELGNSPRVPYLLPELNAADPELPVLLVEGEKDADRAHKEGFMATTTTGGAKNWRKSAEAMAKALNGRRVVIIPDADDASDGYAKHALATLQSVAKAVAVLQLPRLPHTKDHGDDLTDWLDTHGGTVEELKQLVEAAIAGDESDEEPTAPPGDTVLPFPVETLPKALRDVVEQGAKAIGCPVDYLGVPLLVYLGNAIGNTRCLRIKRTWHEGARLWAAIIGLPSEKKSPALELMYQPFERRQRLLEAEWRAAHQAWKQVSPEDRQNEPEPQMAQIATTDATLEALGDLLAANERGMLFHEDELASWALAMNQYKGGRGADRKHWLSFWNGADVIINRRSRPHAVTLHGPFVGVVGALQPDMLGELSDERGRQDGLTHRILFTFPDPMPLTWTEDEVCEETLDAYHTVFAKLWELQPVQDTQGIAHPQGVEFTEAGKAAWVDWITDHYQEQDGPGFPENLRGPWAKLVSCAARFALILQEARMASGEATCESVDAMSMAGAADLIDYFKSHARRVYKSLYASPEDKKVVAAVKWIGRQPGRKTTARALQHAGVAGVTKSDEAAQLIEQLVERGYGTATTTGRRKEFILTWHPTPDK